MLDFSWRVSSTSTRRIGVEIPDFFARSLPGVDCIKPSLFLYRDFPLLNIDLESGGAKVVIFVNEKIDEEEDLELFKLVGVLKWGKGKV